MDEDEELSESKDEKLFLLDEEIQIHSVADDDQFVIRWNDLEGVSESGVRVFWAKL